MRRRTLSAWVFSHCARKFLSVRLQEEIASAAARGAVCAWTNPVKKIAIGLLAASFVLALACEARSQTADGPYDVLATVVLPKGDARAGRQAFENLKCYLCHLVAGESRFPAPAADMRGPDLDTNVRMQGPSDIAAAIIVPSHSSSVRSSDAVKKALGQQMNSPMADFSGTLTIRQLADLLAYLRTRR
jgi:mono/diheme cytochrome c family protein